MEAHGHPFKYGAILQPWLVPRVIRHLIDGSDAQPLNPSDYISHAVILYNSYSVVSLHPSVFSFTHFRVFLQVRSGFSLAKMVRIRSISSSIDSFQFFESQTLILLCSFDSVY